jgi:glycosyltransferase involved in cell wall biosynthesis
MKACAERRFGDLLRIEHIPNAVDTTVFKPVGEKQRLREMLGFDGGKPLILWGAVSMRDPRKGAHFLRDATNLLRQRIGNSFTVAAFGASSDQGLGDGAIGLGVIRDSRLLNLYYNAATLFVLPSLAESFGLVYAEAMAAGTPCVAFDATACNELVREGETGYLAPLADIEGLVSAIERGLLAGDDSPHAGRCRDHIVENCDRRIVGRRYLDVLEDMIRERA